jgi:hypothetical protein
MEVDLFAEGIDQVMPSIAAFDPECHAGLLGLASDLAEDGRVLGDELAL